MMFCANLSAEVREIEGKDGKLYYALDEEDIKLLLKLNEELDAMTKKVSILEDTLLKYEHYSLELIERAQRLEDENRTLTTWKWALAATTIISTVLAVVGFTR